MKRIIVFMLMLSMVMSLAACGGKSKYVTKEQYQGISSEDWTVMSKEDFDEYFGCKGTLDKEETESWDGECEVYTWDGKDDKGKITITFHDPDEDGKFTPASVSSSGDLE